MEMLELVLIIAGLAAFLIGVVVVVKRCAQFFRQKYGFSVWSGVLLVVLGIVLIGYDIAHYSGENYILFIVGGLLFALTIVQDIRFAKWMGITAFLFQGFLAIVFIFLVVLAVLSYILKAFTKRNNAVLDYITGTTRDFREGIMLLPAFLRV